MKIISTALLFVFLLAGCSQNSLNNNTTELNETKLNPLCDIQQNPEDICEGIYLGAEFNKKTNKCKSVSWGCGNPPFRSIDECKSICEWDFEIDNLIKDGCTRVQIDVDGNICSLNENKTAFDSGCTEMETTQKFNVPKCVSK